MPNFEDFITDITEDAYIESETSPTINSVSRTFVSLINNTISTWRMFVRDPKLRLIYHLAEIEIRGLLLNHQVIDELASAVPGIANLN